MAVILRPMGRDLSGSGGHASSSSSSSSSASGSPAHAADDVRPELGDGVACTFEFPRRDCQRPRSCRSCLDVAGCMITASGGCASRAHYDSRRDFLRALDQNLTLPATPTQAQNDSQSPGAEQRWEFRAGAASYCPTTDPVCQRCIANHFWRPKDENARREARQAQCARTTPSLGGWRAHREELITKEREILTGEAPDEPRSTATRTTSVIVSTSPRVPVRYRELRDS